MTVDHIEKHLSWWALRALPNQIKYFLSLSLCRKEEKQIDIKIELYATINGNIVQFQSNKTRMDIESVNEIRVSVL